MKLYADTANRTQVESLYNLGSITGVTTNPSLVAKEPKGDFNILIRKLAEFCKSKDLSLSVEVFETEEKKEFSTQPLVHFKLQRNKCVCDYNCINLKLFYSNQ